MPIKHFEDNTLNCIKLAGGQTDHADSFSSSESMILIALYFGCCAVTSPDNPFQGYLCNLQAMCECVCWGGRVDKNLSVKINGKVCADFSSARIFLLV